MWNAYYQPYQLRFKNTIRTSRGQMRVKNGYYLFITDGKKTGVGECSFIEGLSVDDLTTYESGLQQLCHAIAHQAPHQFPDFRRYPSMAFGYETAWADFEAGGTKLLFPSAFTRGETAIPINGLVWMGDKDFMLHQIEQKLQSGFRCIKIKVAAIDFEEELALIAFIRSRYPKEKMEIRLDANGGFAAGEVVQKLTRLARYDIHSIEQPVKPKQIPLMRQLCNHPIIPVALDEELIGIDNPKQATELLAAIQPQYIILKPSLLGGIKRAEEWIKAAAQHHIGWWATSALESNIGLNAIAQWVFTQRSTLVQGLGTGSLYADNIPSPLIVKNGALHYDRHNRWGSGVVSIS